MTNQSLQTTLPENTKKIQKLKSKTKFVFTSLNEEKNPLKEEKAKSTNDLNITWISKGN